MAYGMLKRVAQDHVNVARTLVWSETEDMSMPRSASPGNWKLCRISYGLTCCCQERSKLMPNRAGRLQAMGRLRN